jgi:hypothetical protein
VTTKGQFIPLTPEIEKASGPSTTEYDRGHSDTSDDERRGPPSVMDSSEYSPVSGVEQEPREVKAERSKQSYYAPWLSLPRCSRGIDRRRS